MSNSALSSTESWKSPEDIAQLIAATLRFEYRTSLSAILGLSELLLIDKQEALSEQKSQIIEQIHQTAAFLMGTTNHLIELERVARGHAIMEFEKADIEMLIRSCLPDHFQARYPC